MTRSEHREKNIKNERKSGGWIERCTGHRKVGHSLGRVYKKCCEGELIFFPSGMKVEKEGQLGAFSASVSYQDLTTASSS